MKNKINKHIKTIVLLLLLVLTSACAQLQCDMNVYPNGEYAYKIHMYVPEEIAELSSLNEDSLIEIARKIFKLDDEKIVPAATNLDGVNYRGLEITHERSLPKENGQIKIEIDDWKNILNFSMRYDNPEDIWIQMNPLGGEDDILKFSTNNQHQLKVVFHMPGEIISSNVGEIEGNDVTIDIMSDHFDEIKIVSKVPFLNPKETAILAVAVVVIIAIIYFVSKKHKNKPKTPASVELEINTNQSNEETISQEVKTDDTEIDNDKDKYSVVEETLDVDESETKSINSDDDSENKENNTDIESLNDKNLQIDDSEIHEEVIDETIIDANNDSELIKENQNAIKIVDEDINKNDSEKQSEELSDDTKKTDTEELGLNHKTTKIVKGLDDFVLEVDEETNEIEEL